MRQLWVVFSEELKRLFRSGGTYVMLALFFVITGMLYLSVFFQASVEPQRYSPLQLFWELQWLPNILWVPLLTMRSLSPERRMGLLASMLSTPTTPAAIVLGKYLAVGLLYLLGWSSVILFMVATQFSGLSQTELAAVFTPSAVWGGALFCVVSGVLFLAVGLWCSSLTRNTILAGALSICVMMLYMLLPTMFGQMSLRDGGFFKPFYHLENLSEYVTGAINLSTAVAYFVGAAVVLFITILSIEQKGE